MKVYYKNRLPHLAPPGGIFFVTFRLSDSLPKKALSHLKEEYSQEKSLSRNRQPQKWKLKLQELYRKKFELLEKHLEIKPFGECYLQNKKIADVVASQIKKYDGTLYFLRAYCILPNHVHIRSDTSVQSSLKANT